MYYFPVAVFSSQFINEYVGLVHDRLLAFWGAIKMLQAKFGAKSLFRRCASATYATNAN
jgi:hypothetical protein